MRAGVARHARLIRAPLEPAGVAPAGARRVVDELPERGADERFGFSPRRGFSGVTTQARGHGEGVEAWCQAAVEVFERIEGRLPPEGVARPWEGDRLGRAARRGCVRSAAVARAGHIGGEVFGLRRGAVTVRRG
jgi:hypothetical protein